ncbi:TIGR03089 family protein, partial [Dietzia sp. E1]|nr:TIGR03089 family protein [Dietzia sp. E1]
ERDDVVATLARVFASGGTAVLVTGADADDPAVAGIADTERTTLTA